MGVVKKIFCSAVFVVFAVGADAAENAQASLQAQGAARATSDLEENIDYEKLSPEELASLIKSLPQIETDPEVLAYEKKVLESFDKFAALEMSLYYLGWGKDVFGQFLIDEKAHFISSPTNAQMASGKGGVRNAKKAFLFCLLSQKNSRSRSLSGFPYHCLAYFYIEEICCKKSGVNLEKMLEANELCRLDVPMFVSCYFSALYAYMNYRGIPPLQKDEKELERNLAHCPSYIWRNFYAGFLVPQDREFALYILKNHPSFKNSAYYLETLAKIYNDGKYFPELKDEAMGKKYAQAANETREKNIAEAKEYSANKDNSFRKNIVVFPNFEEPPVYLENPNYSEASAREYFCKKFEEYREKPRNAFSFALDMLRTGASPQDIEFALQNLQNKFPGSAKTCAAVNNAIILHRFTRESFIRKYLED